MKRIALYALAVATLFALAAPVAMAQDGTLVVKASPKSTGVFVNGKYLGPAGRFMSNKKYSLPAGEHTLMLSEPRYSEHTQKITIEAGKTTTVQHKMAGLPLAQPPFGRLRILGAADTDAVLVNGRFMGHADEFSNGVQRLLLNPGEYLVELMKPNGGVYYKEKVKLTENQDTVVTVK